MMIRKRRHWDDTAKIHLTRQKINFISLLLTVVLVSGVGFRIHQSSHAAAPNFYKPQPQLTFFWGGNTKGPYTSAELQTLASGSHIVVINPIHGKFDLSIHEASARALKALNPSIKVLTYLNTKHYLFEANHPNYTKGFDNDTMALHDPAGNVAIFHTADRAGAGTGVYVDNRAAAWHQFYIGTVSQIIAAGNFDGVAMDSMRPLFGGDPEALAALTPAQQADWNQGQLNLVADVKNALPGKIVLYNGISQVVKNQVNRDLAPFNTADAALNEAFCLEHGQPAAADIVNDLNLMSTKGAAGKIILQQVLVDRTLSSPEQITQYGNFCFGAFMLGYVPGSSYFRYGETYTTADLPMAPSESTLDLGAPKGTYSMSGQVGHRTFQNGQVYVNMGSAATTITLNTPMTRMANGVAGNDYKAGSQLSLGPNQAAFFINDSLFQSATTSPLGTGVAKQKSKSVGAGSAGASAQSAGGSSSAGGANGTETHSQLAVEAQKAQTAQGVKTDKSRTVTRWVMSLLLIPLAAAVFFAVRTVFYLYHGHRPFEDVVPDETPAIVVSPTKPPQTPQ